MTGGVSGSFIDVTGIQVLRMAWTVMVALMYSRYTVCELRHSKPLSESSAQLFSILKVYTTYHLQLQYALLLFITKLLVITNYFLFHVDLPGLKA